jgi:hypothetical protein
VKIETKTTHEVEVLGFLDALRIPRDMGITLDFGHRTVSLSGEEWSALLDAAERGKEQKRSGK